MPHSTGRADRHEAERPVAPHQLVAQRRENPSTRRAERMAERDRPTHDVEPRTIHFAHGLRESGALEQDADVVAFIFREEQYKSPEEREALPEDRKNIAELIIAKQRNGPTGTVDLRFTPSSMRFDNLYRE